MAIMKIADDQGERMVSALANGTLVALSLGRRSLINIAAVLTNGWQFYQAVSGSEQGAGVSTDAVEIERSITVGKSADELYEFWRDPEHLTHIMGRFVDVSSKSEDHQYWKVGRPSGRSIEWKMRIVEDTPGEVLRWESVEGAAVPNEESVRFRSAPGNRGTEVVLQYRFDPPGGALGNRVAKRLHVVLDALVNKVLHRFKSLAETGEIPTLKTNPSARGRGDLL